MTKIVTATAVLQLADRGVLSLDDPVADHLPEFQKTFRPVGSPLVTVRHLLSHSGGLGNPLPITWVHAADSPARNPSTFTRELLSKNSRLKSPPGARAAYSNLGYLVLGEVISRASDQPYVQYIRENILKPLNMRRTDFSYRQDMLSNAATGYQPRWNAMTPLLHLLLPKGIMGRPIGRYVGFKLFNVDGPAYGGLLGPVEDAARFLRLHLNGGEVDGQRLLSTESVSAMQRIAAKGAKLNVGLGWFRQSADSASGHFLEHLGGGAGFWNDMRIYPDKGLGVVVMGNSTRYDHRQIIEAVVASEKALRS